MDKSFDRSSWRSAIGSSQRTRRKWRIAVKAPPGPTRRGRAGEKKEKGNAPQFDLRQELSCMTGTDLIQIDGIDVMTAMTMLRQVGWDMSKWKQENNLFTG
jgi:hypothetical protein